MGIWLKFHSSLQKKSKVNLIQQRLLWPTRKFNPTRPTERSTDLVIHIQPLDKFAQAILWELAATCLPRATYLSASQGSSPCDILPQ